MPTYARESLTRNVRIRESMVVYYGNQQQLEFELVVKPGANPRAIRMKVGGAGKLSVDSSGTRLGSDCGRSACLSAADLSGSNGAKKSVVGHYAVVGRDEVAFRIDTWDRTRDLVIDPTIVYSTPFGGGSSSSDGTGIAVDSSGNILITGNTQATDFPTLNPAQGSFSANFDAFVTKINPAGTALIYSTYLGGSISNVANGLAVDSTGSAWVTGSTTSGDFPLMNAAQSTYGGDGDAFAANRYGRRFAVLDFSGRQQ